MSLESIMNVANEANKFPEEQRDAIIKLIDTKTNEDMREVIAVMEKMDARIGNMDARIGNMDRDLSELKENQGKIISKVTANISIAIAFLGILMTVFALLK